MNASAFMAMVDWIMACIHFLAVLTGVWTWYILIRSLWADLQEERDKNQSNRH